MLDQAMREGRTAERVKARAQDRPDGAEVDLELVDRLRRLAQQLLLDLRGASLKVAGEEIRVQVQMAALDAAAVEDAQGEVVLGEPETLEGIVLGRGSRSADDRQAGESRAGPRAEAPPNVFRAGVRAASGCCVGWCDTKLRLGPCEGAKRRPPPG